MKYSLNLSPRYAPNWGAWEVAREIVCNALDADPDNMDIQTYGPDRLVVTTKTVPDLSDIFVIGAGSKSPGGSTIGQFGEGLKMAALVASRTMGASVKLRMPDKSVTFSFEEVLGTQVLYANLEDSAPFDGYQAEVVMPGVALAFAGRILSEKDSGPIPKVSSKTTRVYCKGVYVREFENLKSIWDWNLADLDINRDRSLVETWDIISHGSTWLDEHGAVEHAEALVADLESWESRQMVDYVSFTSRFSKLVAEQFVDKYGDKAVLSNAAHKDSDKWASEHGFNVVKCPDGMMRLLLMNGVKCVTSVVPKAADLEAVDPAPFASQIAWLRQLDSAIAAPGFSIRVFANRDEQVKGVAVCEDNLMWLSIGLFTIGNELELVRTYLHEAAHLMSDADDATMSFEHALEGIAGRLAMVVLKCEVTDKDGIPPMEKP